jgi:hypothetical protein
MSITGLIAGRYRSIRGALDKRTALREPGLVSLPRPCWKASLRDPSKFYLDCFRFFHQRLPTVLREHRNYFDKNDRGFGEDAFHVMWFLLFSEFKPEDFLEIGVYRGQTISLISLLARIQDAPCVVYGISPFTNASDSVSKYLEGVDYLEDTLANFEHFSLPRPHLLKAFSTELPALDLLHSRQWSAIYIDGSHDYEVVRQDWEACAKSIRDGGIIVLDDSALGTTYRPPNFATGGHPGPSRIAAEIDRSRFREVLQVGHNRVFQKMA